MGPVNSLQFDSVKPKRIPSEIKNSNHSDVTLVVALFGNSTNALADFCHEMTNTEVFQLYFCCVAKENSLIFDFKVVTPFLVYFTQCSAASEQLINWADWNGQGRPEHPGTLEQWDELTCDQIQEPWPPKWNRVAHDGIQGWRCQKNLVQEHQGESERLLHLIRGHLP